MKRRRKGEKRRKRKQHARDNDRKTDLFCDRINILYGFFFISDQIRIL